jgi:regulator of PEP synthase PpsR (kinase-PPPase family)
VAVINKAEGLVITSVLPTVVNSTVSIMISSAVKAPAQFHITDMLGRVVKKISATLNEGSNQLSIDCGSLAKGAYQISAFSESSQSAIRFVKD